MTNQDQDRTGFTELLKLVIGTMTTHGAYNKAVANRVTGEELSKLEQARKDARDAYDRKRDEVLGNLETPEGGARAQNWGYYVQKTFVFGMVNENALRFYTDPRHREELLEVGKLYVAGHKLLNWVVEHGVNPVSVQNLLDGLSAELEHARAALQTDRVQQINSMWSLLDRRTTGMRKRAAARQTVVARQTGGQQTPRTPASRTAATPIKEQAAGDMQAAMNVARNKPPRQTRKSR